ncbi:MAG: PAS domain-containing protein [Parvibaculum sp.]|nr:PAS domain-containing protein [Parvibaculum sp.]
MGGPAPSTDKRAPDTAQDDMSRLDKAYASVDPQELACPTLKAVHAYWNEKRGLRSMPARADINPVELREHLGWIMMVEALDDLADFRYRLIGTKVTRYFFNNSTGQTVTDVFAPFGAGAVKGVQAVYRKAARDHVVVRTHGEANWITNQKTDDPRGFPHFDSLILPLSDDDKTCNMLMVIFTFDYADVLSHCEGALG